MKLSLAVLVFLLIMACHAEKRPSFELLQTDFITNINQHKNGADYYCRQGALFVQDTFYKSRARIQAQWQALSLLDTAFSIAIIKHDSSNYFDLGYYQLEDTTLGQLAYMIAWKEEKGIWCKELEVLYPLEISNKIETQAIEVARQKWEDCSNQHQPDSLMEQVYSEHSFYLNDGYIYKNRKAIQTKYAYMLKEQWHIRLSSLQTLQVNDSLFYDVGQYVSSGKGHYFMLWQLQANGTWRVLLDFNF